MAGEHARVSLRRTGGLAGLSLEATLDTRSLDAARAEAILSALDDVDLEHIASTPDWPPGAADTFHYDLEVERGQASQTASFSDRQLPDELEPVVDALMARAKPSKRKTER